MGSQAEIEQSRVRQAENGRCSTIGGDAAVVRAAQRVLSECRVFVSGLTPTVYSAPSRVLVGGTIGKHLRHTLDHFAAVAPALGGSTICYDNRTRDVPIEVDQEAALSEIHRLSGVFGAINGPELAAPARVRILCSEDGSEAEVGTTLGRELAFATHHAIHHQAMMKAIAIEHGAVLTPAVADGARESRTVVPVGFGVAPSTARHAAAVAGTACDGRSGARAD